jgi:hypothetical protein
MNFVCFKSSSSGDMMILSAQEQHTLIDGARRAPSAHNTQPARWKFAEDGQIILCENRLAHLKIADKLGRDQHIGLGAAFEGLCIQASLLGLELAPAEFFIRDESPGAPDIIPFAATRVIGRGAMPDSAAKYVERRCTYRGVYRKAERVEAFDLLNFFTCLSNVCVVREREEIEEIGRQHDKYSIEFLRDQEYFGELYSWLRFSSKHSRWDKDGLSGEAMQLSAIERILGPVVMHPIAFRIWIKLGLAGVLTGEFQKTRSAECIVFLYGEPGESPFSCGRIFYRFWLEVTKLGFSLCPMSALIDCDEGKRYVESRWGAAPGHQLIGAFRVGIPKGDVVPARRIPVDQLIIA